VPFRDCAAVMECPVTGEGLVPGLQAFCNTSHSHRYHVNDGIPNLFVPVEPDMAQIDVPEMVTALHEETLFPSYDGLNSRESLAAKAKRNLLTAMLDTQLPDGAVILEAGCGTGHLTNFLGMSWRRRIFGGDTSLDALRMANAFRSRFRIVNAGFVQMNLFRPPFRDASLDMVMANGVLHHTSDARGAFNALVRKVKPGGLVLIGLYNRLGRLPALWRGRLFKQSKDQPTYPHASKHSIDETLGWFDANGVEFLSSLPPADGSPFTAANALFEPHPRGGSMQHLSTELKMLLDGGHDGGLFIMIGRKRH
jgi:SAM-dependent methyltransferase